MQAKYIPHGVKLVVEFGNLVEMRGVAQAREITQLMSVAAHSV